MADSTGPLPTVAVPVTAIGHVPMAALALAVNGISASFVSAAIEIEPDEPIPGGLYSIRIAIG